MQKEVSPRFLVRNWSSAFTAWSTRAVRDAFYASPRFPRLLYPETIKATIARGVTEGQVAYGGKKAGGGYDLTFESALDAADVEISEDVFILKPEDAKKYIEPPKLSEIAVKPTFVQLKPAESQTFTVEGHDQFGSDFGVPDIEWSASGGEVSDGLFAAGETEGSFAIVAKAWHLTATAEIRIATAEKPIKVLNRKLKWSGEISPQKWTNFYMKVLTQLVSAGDVKLNVSIEAEPKDGVTDQRVEETKAALRGLGLDDDVKKE